MTPSKILVVTAFALVAAAANATVGAGAAPAASDRLANGRSIYGIPASVQKTDTVVDVDKRSYVNVECGQTVVFKSGEKTFAWKFETVGHRAVPLASIAPAGFTSKRFTVHVDANDSERN